MQLQSMISTQIHAHPKPEESNLLAQLALVESQLLSLQDVTVATSTLSRTGRDDGEKTTGLELLLQSGLDLSVLGETLRKLLLDALALLLRLSCLLTSLLLTSPAQVLTVVRLVPLSEGSGIDLNDGGLGEGVGSDELVVGGVVHDDDDSDLASNTFGGPGEVTGLKTEGTELAVATAGTDEMDSLGTDPGVGFLSAGFESALLPCKFLVFRLEHMSCDIWAFYYAR